MEVYCPVSAEVVLSTVVVPHEPETFVEYMREELPTL
jgi:hypothetical protein